MTSFEIYENITMILRIGIPLLIVVRLILSFIKNHKINMKRFKITKLIDDITISLLEVKDETLKQGIQIRVKTICQRINDFKEETIAAGNLWTFLLVGTFTNRTYHLIKNELEEHIQKLEAIKTLIPKPII